MHIFAFFVVITILLTLCSEDAKQKLKEHNKAIAFDKETALIQELETQGKLPKLDRTNTLTGIDASNNGIRDDIEAYINQNYMAEIRPAARQFAKAMQKTLLVPPGDRDAAREPDMESSKALQCVCLIGRQLKQQGKLEEDSYYKIIDEIEAITANTELRLKAYMAYNKSLDGTTGFSFDDIEVCDNK